LEYLEGQSPRGGSDEFFTEGNKWWVWISPVEKTIQKPPKYQKINSSKKKTTHNFCALFFCIMFVEEIGHLQSLIHPKHG